MFILWELFSGCGVNEILNIFNLLISLEGVYRLLFNCLFKSCEFRGNSNFSYADINES